MCLKKLSILSRKLRYVLLGLMLVGCGFQPLYSINQPGIMDTVLSQNMAQIAIQPIADKPGHFMRNLLLDRLNPKGNKGEKPFSLTTALQITNSDLGLRKDKTSRRNRQTVVADFVLRLDANTTHNFTLKATNGFSTTEAAYAEIVAQQHATEQNLIYLADQAKIRIATLLIQHIQGSPATKN